MTINQEVAGQLKSLIDRQLLQSQRPQYLSTNLHLEQENYDAFLNRRGVVDSEVSIAAYERDNKKSALATTILPVVRGMLDLTEADPYQDLFKIVNVGGNSRFPTSRYIQGPSTMIVMQNPGLPVHSAQFPKGFRRWSPACGLGLQRVTLQTGRSDLLNEITAELGLVFPCILSERDNSRRAGFSLLKVNLFGQTEAHSYWLAPQSSGFVDFTLGVASAESMCLTGSSSGDYFQCLLGVENYTEFLIQELPCLGRYFSELALQLKNDIRQFGR